jgi:MFS transporter, FHS family, L-fucose permease
MSSSVPFTEKRYVVPFILIATLFFMWAIGVNLNDILIPHLKKAFGLTDFQSSLIQSAFFGGYFLMALPAGLIVQRVGYKKGILTGLLICATGTLLFLPAASVRLYGFFLFALFVMACGQCFLEVSSYPCLASLGPRESSAQRLNWAAFFNSVGAVMTPIIGATFILSGIEHTPAELAAMTQQQLLDYRIAEASTVKLPYLCVAGIFLLVAFMMYLNKLPEGQETSPASGGETQVSFSQAWKHPHLIRGVVAQFFYVGAQVGVASFIIRFSQRTIHGIHEKSAAHFLLLHQFAFLVGRFAGSALLKYVSPSRLLSLFAGSSLVCLGVALSTSGYFSVWAVVLIGFFHSVMFPTIFDLSLKDLGPYTKLGSSLLVMAIVGGAICPAIMGLISDHFNIQRAFVVVAVCHAYVLYFGLRGYRHTESNPPAFIHEVVPSEGV